MAGFMNKRLPRSLLVVLLAAALGAFFALDLGRWLSLEQLRALWHGDQIVVEITDNSPEAGVDTPQDLARVRARLTQRR